MNVQSLSWATSSDQGCGRWIRSQKKSRAGQFPGGGRTEREVAISSKYGEERCLFMKSCKENNNDDDDDEIAPPIQKKIVLLKFLLTIQSSPFCPGSLCFLSKHQPSCCAFFNSQKRAFFVLFLHIFPKAGAAHPSPVLCHLLSSIRISQKVCKPEVVTPQQANH